MQCLKFLLPVLIPALTQTKLLNFELCIILIFFYYLRDFHINVSWWSSTGIWMKTSLLKSPGLFPVFWPFSIMLYFGWSPLVLLFPSPLVLLPILLWLYQEHHLKIVSIYNLDRFPCKVQVLLFLFTPFHFYPVVNPDSIVNNFASSIFRCWLLLGLVVWPRLGDPSVLQNFRGICASYSPGQILGGVYTVRSYGQISISCISPSGPPCLPIYSFCAHLVLSFKMWLIVSSLSPHNRQYDSSYYYQWFKTIQLYV